MARLLLREDFVAPPAAAGAWVDIECVLFGRLREGEQMAKGCELCENAGGDVLWEDDFSRAVWAYEPDHPGFCRVIWDKHVKEMADLAPADRERIMRVVFAVEKALIDVVAPDKVNIASLGNAVPHVYWHVIPRFRNDPHFPNPVWGHRVREGAHPLPADFAMRMRKALDALLKPRGLVSRG